MPVTWLDEPETVSNALTTKPWSNIVTNPQTEWIIESLIPRGKQVHLYSESGIGKSLIALHLAICIAEGTPAFANFDTIQGKVLLMDYENGPIIIKERMESYGYQGDDMLWFEDKIYLALYPEMPTLDSVEAAQVMEATIDEIKPDLVIVDSIGLAFEGEENSADTYKGFGRNMGRLLRERNIAALLLDNTGKDRTRGSRGSSRKKDEADLMWLLTESPGDTYQLTNQKDRIGGSPKAIAISKLHEPHLHWKITAEQQLSPQAKAIIERCVTASVTPISVTDARNKGVTGEQRYVAEAVKWMKANDTNGYKP